MIGQYLSNTNEKATVSILQNILELNKAQPLSVQGRKEERPDRTRAERGGNGDLGATKPTPTAAAPPSRAEPLSVAGPV